jgi:hypothetical protein
LWAKALNVSEKFASRGEWGRVRIVFCQRNMGVVFMAKVLKTIDFDAWPSREAERCRVNEFGCVVGFIHTFQLAKDYKSWCIWFASSNSDAAKS